MTLLIDQVKVIKLVTGEELISIATTRVQGSKTDHILKYPMSTYPTQEGTYVFVPFCGIAETDEVVIPDDKLLCAPLTVQTAFFDEYAKIVAAQQSIEKEPSVFVPEASGIVYPN